ncbi:MAG: methyltransferase domain-containing protein [Chloroflexi bacterium]|nr:methyltransferase domain-containing protein [Chloroflexota bacterium]
MNQGITTASQRWLAMVETEHAQTARVRGPEPLPEDHWGPFADRFRADPFRTNDPLVQRLLRELEPHHTLIDVGAGGGRLALPLSLRCKQVIAVEPSDSMCAVLREEAQQAQRDNVAVVQAKWEDAEVDQADAVLCVHVLYTIRGIGGFVRKMEAHAREKVLVVMYTDPPQSQNYPLWPSVHGEERLPLPCLQELMAVLWEMGTYPSLEMLPPQEQRGFESRERAFQQLKNRLFLVPGSDKEHMLEKALDEMLEEVDGRFQIKGAPTHRPGLVSWRPSH